MIKNLKDANLQLTKLVLWKLVHHELAVTTEEDTMAEDAENTKN
jgi:hypothetical protein